MSWCLAMSEVAGIKLSLACSGFLRMFFQNTFNLSMNSCRHLEDARLGIHGDPYRDTLVPSDHPAGFNLVMFGSNLLHNVRICQ